MCRSRYIGWREENDDDDVIQTVQKMNSSLISSCVVEQTTVFVYCFFAYKYRSDQLTCLRQLTHFYSSRTTISFSIKLDSCVDEYRTRIRSLSKQEQKRDDGYIEVSLDILSHRRERERLCRISAITCPIWIY